LAKRIGNQAEQSKFLKTLVGGVLVRKEEAGERLKGNLSRKIVRVKVGGSIKVKIDILGKLRDDIIDSCRIRIPWREERDLRKGRFGQGPLVPHQSLHISLGGAGKNKRGFRDSRDDLLMVQESVMEQLMGRISLSFPAEGVGVGRGNLKGSFGDIPLVMSVQNILPSSRVGHGDLREAKDACEGPLGHQAVALEGEGDGREGIKDPLLVVVECDLELGGGLGEGGRVLAVDGEDGVLAEEDRGHAVVDGGHIGHPADDWEPHAASSFGYGDFGPKVMQAFHLVLHKVCWGEKG